MLFELFFKKRQKGLYCLNVNKNIRFKSFLQEQQVIKNIILVKNKWDLLEIVNPIFYLTKNPDCTKGKVEIHKKC